MECIISLFLFTSLYHFSSKDSFDLIGMVKLSEFKEGVEYVHRKGIILFFPSVNKTVFTDTYGVYFFKIPSEVNYLRGPEIRFKEKYFSFSEISGYITPEYGFAIFSFGRGEKKGLKVSLRTDYDTLLKWAEENYEGENKDTLLNLIRAYKVIEKIEEKMPIDTILRMYFKSINIIPTIKAVSEVFYTLKLKMDTNGVKDTLLFRDICDKIISGFLIKSKGKYILIHRMIKEILLEHADYSTILKSLEKAIKKFCREDTLLYHLYLISIVQSDWVSAESLAFEMVKNYPQIKEHFSVYYFTLLPDIYLSEPDIISPRSIASQIFTILTESNARRKRREISERINTVFSHIKELEKSAKYRDTLNLIKAYFYLKNKKDISEVKRICKKVLKRHPFWSFNVYLLFLYAIETGDNKKIKNLADYVLKNKSKFKLSCFALFKFLKILQSLNLEQTSLEVIKNLYNFITYHLNRGEPPVSVPWMCQSGQIYEGLNNTVTNAYRVKITELIKKGESAKAEELINEVFEKFPCHKNTDLWFIYAKFNKKDKDKLLSIYRQSLACGVWEFYDSLMVLVEKMYDKETAKKILYEEAFNNKSVYVLKRLKEWLKKNNMDYSEVEKELKKVIRRRPRIR